MGASNPNARACSDLLSREAFPLHTLNNHPIAPVLLRMMQLNTFGGVGEPFPMLQRRATGPLIRLLPRPPGCVARPRLPPSPAGPPSAPMPSSATAPFLTGGADGQPPGAEGGVGSATPAAHHRGAPSGLHGPSQGRSTAPPTHHLAPAAAAAAGPSCANNSSHSEAFLAARALRPGGGEGGGERKGGDDPEWGWHLLIWCWLEGGGSVVGRRSGVGVASIEVVFVAVVTRFHVIWQPMGVTQYRGSRFYEASYARCSHSACLPRFL